MITIILCITLAVWFNCYFMDKSIVSYFRKRIETDDSSQKSIFDNWINYWLGILVGVINGISIGIGIALFLPFHTYETKIEKKILPVYNQYYLVNVDFDWDDDHDKMMFAYLSSSNNNDYIGWVKTNNIKIVNSNFRLEEYHITLFNPEGINKTHILNWFSLKSWVEADKFIAYVPKNGVKFISN